MKEDRLRSYGVLLLRVALGTMFIAHSMVYMLMTLTLDWDGQVLRLDRTAGLARLCDVLGRGGRWSTPHSGYPNAMGGAGALADPDRCDLGSFRKWLAVCLLPYGGWEYPLDLFVLCIAQAMLGDGAYALAPSRLGASGASPRQMPARQ